MLRSRLPLFFASLSVAALGLGWAQSGVSPQNATPAPAEQNEAPARTRQPLATFHTQSNMVIVDVVVRSKGQPVHGLKASDFRVFEDGRPQTVSVFEEHRATDALRVSQLPADLPPHTYSNAPRYAVTSAANVLLLDALNTPYGDQVYVRRKMLQYLRTIPPGTRIAVFTLSSKLRMIEGFTTDSSVIEKALTEGRGHPERSPMIDPQYDAVMNDMTDIAGGSGATALAQVNMAQFTQDMEKFQLNLRAQLTMDALAGMARFLSTIPGRKNLIWFTGSMSMSLPMGSNSATLLPQQSFESMKMEDADFTGQVREVLQLMNLARVAVYPVDARGLIGVPSDMANTVYQNPGMMNSAIMNQGAGASQGSAYNPMSGPSGTGMLDSTMLSQKVEQHDRSALADLMNDHIHMDQIATETGGLAIYNNNALGQSVEADIANGSNYYTLAYAPTNPVYDGAYRRIRVLAGEGNEYQLEYRQGYFAADQATTNQLIPGRISPMVTAMQHGVLPLSQVPFEVRVLPASDPAVQGEPKTPGPAGKMAASLKAPVTRYMADYTIDPRQLQYTVLPDGRWHEELELTQVAFDSDGIRENFTDTGLAINTPPVTSDAAMKPIHLHQEIDMPAGDNYLRVGIRDLRTGNIGTLEVPVHVTKK